MAIRIENGMVYGVLTLNTTVDPITKSKPDARNIKVNGVKFKFNGLPVADFEREVCVPQIGIRYRAAVREWDATEIRATGNKVHDYAEFFKPKARTVVVMPSRAEMLEKAKTDPAYKEM